MLKSMTGFGRGSYEDADFSVNIEMKTVNHRYNEVAIRLPRFLNPLEDKIRKTILKTVSRGRIDVFITADYNVTISTVPGIWIAPIFGFKEEKGLVTPTDFDQLTVSKEETKNPKLNL